MGALLVLGVVAAFIAAISFGTWIGRSWKSLPTTTPGSVVKFQGYTVGVEHHMVIEEIHHDRDKTTVVLVAQRKPERAPR